MPEVFLGQLTEALEGLGAAALEVLAEMKERATRAEVSPYYFAEAYVALGDVDKAVEYLRRSYELRIPDMIGIGVDPLFQSLHGRPEFDKILQTLGITAVLLVDRHEDRHRFT